MKCPKCEAEIPARQEAKSHEAREARTRTVEDAEHADAPPAPCPQCGWSVMWNE